MQAAIVRRKAKLRNVRAGPGSGGSHRLQPEHCALRAKGSVNERRAMQNQVESEQQAQWARNTKDSDQAVRDQTTEFWHGRKYNRTCGWSRLVGLAAEYAQCDAVKRGVEAIEKLSGEPQS